MSSRRCPPPWVRHDLAALERVKAIALARRQLEAAERLGDPTLTKAWRRLLAVLGEGAP